ncbi:MAG: YeaC family protein [Halioglobus sp.]
MQYDDLINALTPDTYERLKRAVETGKWPDGSPLTPEQRATSLQAVIAWSEKNLPPERRVGFIDRGHKAGDTCDDPEEQPLNWQE